MQNKQTGITTKTSAGSRHMGKKILFANVPADGHFNPMTGLAKHLQSAGYDVRWYSSSAYESKLEKLQIPFFPFKKALEVTGSNVDEIFPQRRKIKNKIKKLNHDIVNFFTLRGPEYYADIRNIYQSFPFDLMIADSAFTGIPFVKDLLNIPVISIGVFPLCETSKDLPPSGLGMTPSYSLFGKLKQAVLRTLTNRLLFRSANKVMSRTLGEYNIPDESSGIFDIMSKKSDLLLQSGTPGFEYYRSDLSANVRFIGPLLPYKAGRKNAEQWFDNRLLQHDKIILVTQGTVEKDIEKILVPALEAFKNTDTLVVATTGGSQTEVLRKRFPDNNFIIEDFIPFDDIMPYADVYVSNGGYGGVMLAIENQLPMVVAGVHEGKNEINARIGYFGLGINLKTETPKPATMRSAVETVLANDKYKRNIIKLGKEFGEYDPNALCEEYVARLLSSAATHSSGYRALVNN